ncbi:MAG: glycyl radical protein [Coprothermobacter sp.]|nr:glycyl radical protein [Coprothermobacter sp.]
MNGITERVHRLREKYLATPPALDAERAVIITRSYQETEGEPMIMRRAKAMKKLLNEMTIWIADDELIVGNQAKVARSAPVFPEFSYDWIIEEMDNEPFEEGTADRFLIDEETKKTLRGLYEYWKGKKVNDLVLNMLPEESKKAIETSGVFAFGIPEVAIAGVGHYSPNYKTILEKGFSGVKKDALKQLEQLGIPRDGRDIEKYHFWNAIIMVCDAVADFAKRYANLARELADKETNKTRKIELLQIASNCDWVPENPARTFWEACQSFWFLQLVLQLESSGHSVSPGRFDQYMYPYYQKDIAAGNITKDGAQELIECLWIKLSEISKIRPFGITLTAAGNPMFQNLCVGGQTRDGRDATNELSYMCLDATMNVKLHQPSISVRIWNGTPDELWYKAIQVTKQGLGMPAFYNDEVIIPALLNRGRELEDARDYAIVGCVEPACQGFEYGWCGGTGDAPFFSLPACLELAINNGVNMLTGVKSGPATGDLASFSSFDEVKEAYVKQVQYFVDHFAVITNVGDLANMQLVPLPVLSCAMEPCVEKGVDVSAGGAKYNCTGTAGVGVSNVADALSAIKKFVFDEKKYSGAELLSALRSNWEGQEALRNEIITSAPSYGNNDAYVDDLARWAAGVYCKLTEECSGPRGPYSPGFYPVVAHIYMGYWRAASLDGRRAGEPLADGISPVHGKDKNGPTAILNSAAAVDHLINSNGTLLNLKFHPTAVEGDSGTRNLISAIKTFFDNKGMHLQYNVVSSKTLRDAQKNPDKYRGLVVRVAGYSALFVGLHPAIQEDIIERTEYTELV